MCLTTAWWPLRLQGADGSKAGITVSRWADGVLEAKENMDQPNPIKAMVFWGHAPNSQTREPDLKKAMEKLDLLVVIDPHPTVTAVLHDRTDGVYLLPAATQFETVGSVTASNRSLQWREKVFEPFFEASPTTRSCICSPRSSASTRSCSRTSRSRKRAGGRGHHPRVQPRHWSIGYTGQSPERLKLHMANQHTFDKTTLRANGGPCDGDYYGLPWPCWGTPDMKHPGTANLYDTSKHVMDGGLTFRARFGVESRGQNICSPRAHGRKARRSRMAIRSSPWRCCRSWAGTRI